MTIDDILLVLRDEFINNNASDMYKLASSGTMLCVTLFNDNWQYKLLGLVASKKSLIKLRDARCSSEGLGEVEISKRLKLPEGKRKKFMRAIMGEQDRWKAGDAELRELIKTICK